jgi:AbiV family abortive infection protein
MGKKDGWVVPVTPEIRRNIENTAHAAYMNGSNLRQDAVTLFESCRYPRAVALAILAEEEFSKALILKASAEQGRWDSNLYKALHKHPEKQGIVEGIMAHAIWFIGHAKFIERLNRVSLVQVRPSMLPGDKEMEKILSNVKSYFKKPIKDKLKQNSIYVSIDKSGKTTSKPDQIGKEEAETYLNKSYKMNVITEVAFGDYSNAKDLEDIL